MLFLCSTNDICQLIKTYKRTTFSAQGEPIYYEVDYGPGEPYEIPSRYVEPIYDTIDFSKILPDDTDSD